MTDPQRRLWKAVEYSSFRAYGPDMMAPERRLIRAVRDATMEAAIAEIALLRSEWEPHADTIELVVMDEVRERLKLMSLAESTR